MATEELADLTLRLAAANKGRAVTLRPAFASTDDSNVYTFIEASTHEDYGNYATVDEADDGEDVEAMCFGNFAVVQDRLLVLDWHYGYVDKAPMINEVAGPDFMAAVAYCIETRRREVARLASQHELA